MPIMLGFGNGNKGSIWFILVGAFLVFRCAEVFAFHEGFDTHWKAATATWYGDPDGDGSTGGACGYGDLVDVKPFRAHVGAASPIMYKNGEGCGACYKIKCLGTDLCRKKPVTVIITDECPGGGGYCGGNNTHFDLSGSAFGHLAVPGQDGSLRNRGVLNLLYRRIPCKYRGKNIAFHVNQGSNDYWLSLMVEFEDGDGDVGSMQIKQANTNDWIEMTHLWGAYWYVNSGGPLKGPFSVKLATLSTGKILSARDVIPRNWSPAATYTSRLNFTPK